eukprot:6470000-Amphidinium_carterae.1
MLWGIALGGVLLLSVYLTVGQPRQRLLEELAAIATWVNGQPRPYVVGGDWNISPEMLRETGFLGQVKGRLVASEEPSVHAPTWRDYFVVSEVLSHRIHSIQVMPSLTKPHHAVLLTLHGRQPHEH